MARNKTTWARVQMLLIASVFLGPLVVAAWMYYGGHFAPTGRTNNGVLLDPIVSLTAAMPQSALLQQGDGHWLLVYANNAHCESACKEALFTLRQSRQMLGKEMDRVLRVFLHGDSSPDTVFVAAEHNGLMVAQDDELLMRLYNKKPAALEAGGYYLIDPLGNLVMYFRPDIDPSDMVGDIKQLLKLSRIG